jgi:hypothetical protein
VAVTTTATAGAPAASASRGMRSIRSSVSSELFHPVYYYLPPIFCTTIGCLMISSSDIPRISWYFG